MIMMLVASVLPVQAAVRHADVALTTYVDVATNSGRYTTGSRSELQDYLRREEGVRLYYTGGQESYTLPHGVPDFSAVADLGNGTAVSYNYVVTVKHNGVLDPTFSGNEYGVGSTRCIVYKGVEEASANGSFVHNTKADYKITRLSKIITDAAPAEIYRLTYNNGKTDMKGATVYRVGGGQQLLMDHSGKSTEISSAGTYTVAGIAGITYWADSTAVGSVEDTKNAQVTGTTSWSSSGVGEASPLPFGSTEGDSGSPYFVWNEDTKSFQFLMAHTGSFGGNPTVAAAAPEWTLNTMEADNAHVDMAYTDGTVKIVGTEMVEADDAAVVKDTISGYNITTTPWRGYLYNGNGTTIMDGNWDPATFHGVEKGMHTWKSLSGLKDSQHWYHYGNEYLNAAESVVIENKESVVNTGLTYAELYQTQNLVFDSAKSGDKYTIQVNEDTDLGLGYLHFAAENVSGVEYNLVSAGGHQLDSAGYVVDAGVTVNVQLRNADEKYMREWRKVGAGDMRLCAEGRNEIFLNLGGSGTTYLEATGKAGEYYAAYNVLVNTGAKVVIADTGQIARDFTFGSGGGTLDMNGNSMDWYTTGGELRKGSFTINALTEDATITNSSSTHSTLTYRETKEQSFVGSFRDSAQSSLSIVYAGNGTLELTGTRTILQNAASGLTVENGTVRLVGTPTVHGYGSTHTLTTADFSTRENDWHYADATMNVSVQKGATFELGSHARLKGDVTVQTGGTFLLREGVQRSKEYAEGGEALSDTAELAAFYGHKGQVKVQAGGTMAVVLSAQTETDSIYTGSIQGEGTLEINTAATKSRWVAQEKVNIGTLSIAEDSHMQANNGTAAHQIRIAAGGTLSVAQGLTLSATEPEGTGTLLGVQASATGKQISLAARDAATPAGLNAVCATLQEGTELTLSNVYVDALSQIYGNGSATLTAKNVTMQLSASNSSLTLSRMSSGVTFSTAAVAEEGELLYELNSSALAGNITLAGTQLVLDLTTMVEELQCGESLRVTFGTEGDSITLRPDSSLSITALLGNGQQLSGTYSTEEPGAIYFEAVPEPATATLSLLALAALAGRRRRA